MKKTTLNPISQPRTREGLSALIYAEINKNGNQCDLNHIDVSLITDFSKLFYGSKFNGEISKWNVRAENMYRMFSGSEFNGDISAWDVSESVNMASMFENSIFNRDISGWDVSSVRLIDEMFTKSNFESDISGWNLFSVLSSENMFFNSGIAKKIGTENPSFDQVKSHFLGLKLELDLKDASLGQCNLGRGDLGKVRL